MGTVTTDTKELDNSRVHVDVEVPATTVEQQLSDAATAIGRDMRVDGFRKGKVPPQVVLQQVGREAVLDQAVREGLPEWYEAAVSDAGLAVVGSPDLDLADLPDKGAPLSFSFEVAVRPPATLGDWKGVEAPKREAEASDEDVDAELGRLRESLASLETVEAAAAENDYVVIDFEGFVDGEPFEGGDARGFLLELGSGRLVPGFEEQLVGASAGDDRDVVVTFPEDYQAENLAGNEATFKVSVSEVKTKKLPELDDDLAIEAGGYDSLDELKDDLRTRIAQAQEDEIEREFREAAVDAAATTSTVEIPKELVHAKAHDMWHQTAHRLQHQGLDPQQYLQFVNKTEEELVTETEPDAERALRRESTLAAVIEAEGIEVSDDEVMEALRDASSQPGQKPPSEKALRRSLEKARKRGQDEALREDIAMRKAVDLIVASAKPIPQATADAREEIWTPEDEKAEGDKEIWTPDKG